MNIVGQFHIEESLTINRIGFTILGQLTKGSINKGNHIIINTDTEPVSLTIRGIDFADNISTNESRLALTFTDENNEQKALLTRIKVPRQHADIWAD